MTTTREILIALNEAEIVTCEGRYFYDEEGFEIAAKSKVLAGDEKKFRKLSEIMKFIEDNYEAFLYHWNKRWSDLEMLLYIEYVAKGVRGGKTKSQAISLLIKNEYITEYPEGYMI